MYMYLYNKYAYGLLVSEHKFPGVYIYMSKVRLSNTQFMTSWLDSELVFHKMLIAFTHSS